MPRPLTSLLLVLFASSASAAEEGGFVPLFDGETLDGWVQRGGDALYAVETPAGEPPRIVGTSVADTPNSFLCTDREYGDFVLELELRVDPLLNSGVQFRSLCFDQKTEVELPGGQIKKIPAGRVHGYQMEIDPSNRSYSGGVYDEARRGWLVEPKGDAYANARAAFDADGWNHYRIEARGSSIKTFVNGVPVADFTDDMTPRGLIALQVHSVHSPEKVGKQVRWRNVRIKELSVGE